MGISLCMIVKNEENILEKCLNSIREYVDEIIIVDTGSLDKTKEIARKYTEKIYDFEWCDDFSKARNYSISKASNDWVLVLDADETVTKFNRKSINKFMKMTGEVVGRIKILSSFKDDKEVKQTVDKVSRFFNKKFFEYKGIIHEQIVMKNLLEYSTKPIEIEVNHIGYMDDVVEGTNKLERNISLLKSALKTNPNDEYILYQLGKTYYKSKNYKVACQNFEKSLEMCNNCTYEYIEDLVESYGYALLKCEEYEKALEIQRYKKYYKNSPDFNFVLGLIYMNNGKFDSAISCFEECIGDKEGKVEGVNSYQAYYNIGVINEMVGNSREAISSYLRCGKYQLAKERIVVSLQKLIEDGFLKDAKKYIVKSIDIYNQNIELLSMKAIVDIIEERYHEAEGTLISALSIDNKNVDLLYNLGYLNEVQSKNRVAVEYYKRALLYVNVLDLKSDIQNRVRRLENK